MNRNNDKGTKNVFLQMTEKMALKAADPEGKKWPFCIGLLHQPKRPAAQSGKLDK